MNGACAGVATLGHHEEEREKRKEGWKPHLMGQVLKLA